MSWLFIEDQEEALPGAIRDFEFGAALPTGWSLSRSEAALGRSPTDGRWVSYPANTARPEINPVTLAYDGVIVEHSAAQIVLNSRSPAYFPSNATNVTDGAIQTPFGMGSLKLTPNATVAIHGFDFFFTSPRSATIADNTTVAIHAVMKPVGAYTRGRFALLGRDGVYRTVSFDLTGAGSIPSVTGTVTDATIAQDTDGFYAVKIVMNFGVGTTGPACNMSFAQADGNRTFAGDGTSHFLIAYFGVEVGDAVTSPIISAGTVTTRSAEILKTAVNWPQATGVSIGIDYTPLTRGAFTVFHASADTSASGDFLELLNRPNPEGALYRVVAGGVSSAFLEGAIPEPGLARTAVVSAGPDHFRLAVDGAQIGADANGPMAIGLATLSVGSGANGTNGGAMIVRRIKAWQVTLDRDGVEAYSGDLSIEGESPNLPILEVQPSRVVTPNETSITLVLSLDRPAVNTSVGYRTVDGTATAGVDYVGVSGVMLFDFGQSVASITILMAARALSEDRAFTFELFDPLNCSLANSTCVITLQRVIPAGTVATTQFNFDSPTLSADWTLTRTTAANSRNAAGLWVSTGAGLPRRHYHAPGIGGLLLEPLASEQRLYDSVDPAFGVVEATKTIVTTEQTATGMRQLQWRKNTAAADHKLTGTLAAPNADMPTGEFTLWFLARPVNWPRWKLRVKGIDNVWRETRLNLSGPGSVTASETGTTVYAEQDRHFPDWYQFGMHRTQTTTAGVSAEFELIPVTDTGASSTTGDTTHGIDICHAQLEPVAGMTSPLMVTGASAKTIRAADALKATTTSTWHKEAVYTVGIHFIRLRNQPTTQRLLMMKDQSVAVAPDDIGFSLAPTSLRARIKVQGVQLPEIISSDLTVAGIADTGLLIVSASKIAMFHNGVKSGENVLTTAPVAVGALRVGSTEPNGNEPMSVLVQQVYHWDHAIPETDAELFSGNLTFVPVGEMPKPIVSVPTAISVLEGEIVQVPVNKSGSGACQVNIRTKGNTAISLQDYNGIGPVAVSFGAGETQKLVPVQTLGDTAADPNETFTVLLELIAGNNTCSLGNAACAVTITEPPRVAVPTTVNVMEGQAASVAITKTGTGACSVTYRTVGVDAVNTVDYTGIGATLVSFGASETTKTVTIPTLMDATSDSGEKFNVVLETPTNCTLGNASCSVVINEAGVEPDPVGQLYDPVVAFANTTSTGTKIDFGIGQVPYYVTSLADTNTQGTLRHALSASNRLILFEVGGCIKLPYLTGLSAAVSNVTVAGETAPSPGIILQDGTLFLSRSNRLNVRHLTIERGYDTRQESFVATNPPTRSYNSNGDAIIIQGNGVTRNVWIDHCATFWSNDESIQIWRDNVSPTDQKPEVVVDDISITNTIIAEPLYRPELLTNPATGQKYKGHWEQGVPERDHNYATIIGDGCKRIDYQHCLITDAYWRSPIIGGGTSIVLANIVSLNGVLGAHYGGASGFPPTYITCVGYLKIAGADTSWRKTPGIKLHGTNGTDYNTGSRVWYSNLYGDRGKSTYPLPDTVIWGRFDSPTLTSVEQSIVRTSGARPIDIPTAPVQALSQQELYDRTLLNCGPRPKDRDANGKHVQPHVQRIYDKLKAKDGKWINHQSEVGGFSSFFKTSRSLRDGTGKFKDGTTIPAFPSDHTNKTAVRAWLRRFLDDVQYD